nr:uncharacterized protein CI109_002961 [Kwoniella shandongensis]KAA5528801.1 hypothetical protein CI109_002961 [Kwoniella shandongensis]
MSQPRAPVNSRQKPRQTSPETESESDTELETETETNSGEEETSSGSEHSSDSASRSVPTRRNEPPVSEQPRTQAPARGGGSDHTRGGEMDIDGALIRDASRQPLDEARNARRDVVRSGTQEQALAPASGRKEPRRTIGGQRASPSATRDRPAEESQGMTTSRGRAGENLEREERIILDDDGEATKSDRRRPTDGMSATRDGGRQPPSRNAVNDRTGRRTPGDRRRPGGEADSSAGPGSTSSQTISTQGRRQHSSTSVSDDKVRLSARRTRDPQPPANNGPRPTRQTPLRQSTRVESDDSSQSEEDSDSDSDLTSSGDETPKRSQPPKNRTDRSSPATTNSRTRGNEGGSLRNTPSSRGPNRPKPPDKSSRRLDSDNDRKHNRKPPTYESENSESDIPLTPHVPQTSSSGRKTTSWKERQLELHKSYLKRPPIWSHCCPNGCCNKGRMPRFGRWWMTFWRWIVRKSPYLLALAMGLAGLGIGAGAEVGVWTVQLDEKEWGGLGWCEVGSGGGTGECATAVLYTGPAIGAWPSFSLPILFLIFGIFAIIHLLLLLYVYIFIRHSPFQTCCTPPDLESQKSLSSKLRQRRLRSLVWFERIMTLSSVALALLSCVLVAWVSESEADGELGYKLAIFLLLSPLIWFILRSIYRSRWAYLSNTKGRQRDGKGWDHEDDDERQVSSYTSGKGGKSGGKKVVAPSRRRDGYDDGAD